MPPALIRRLGVAEDDSEEEHEELRARLTGAGAALERLDELAVEEWTQEDTVKRVRAMYEFRRRRFKVRAGKIDDEDGIEDRSVAYQRLMHELYAAQRGALVDLRDSGRISAEVMRHVERELASKRSGSRCSAVTGAIDCTRWERASGTGPPGEPCRLRVRLPLVSAGMSS